MEQNKEAVMSKQNEYREINKNLIREKARNYQKLNYDSKIKEKRALTYTCECGTCLTIVHKARHELTIKHKSYVDSLIT